MWPDLIQKSKDGGLDVIQTFVFWNLHEPIRGQVNLFILSLKCSLFIILASSSGLFSTEDVRVFAFAFSRSCF